MPGTFGHFCPYCKITGRLTCPDASSHNQYEDVDNKTNVSGKSIEWKHTNDEYDFVSIKMTLLCYRSETEFLPETHAMSEAK